MSSVENVISSFNTHRSEFLSDLKDLVRIPSVSFSGFDPENVKASAEFTAKLMKKHGLENVQVIPFEGAHPYVYGEWLNAPGKPTLLLYAGALRTIKREFFVTLLRSLLL
jgi:cysteinylglycine-S-conjugate dipeptidase